MKNLTLAAGFAVLAAPAFADGHADVAAGEEAFNRNCVSCHVVVNDEGETLAGRNAQTGPNLYGLHLRPIGSVEGFRYGDSIVEVGEAGGMWDEESFVGYTMDPTSWLRETLDNNRARGRMAFQLRDQADAVNIYAYLVSLSPADQ